MKDEKKSERILITISPSEIERIDDWRFANRIDSRSKAIRLLCELGLKHSAKMETPTD